MGLRVERARLAPANRTLRTVGRVTMDEDRLYPVTAGSDGWVMRIEPGTATGNSVRQGQPLASVYGREYATAQRAFLYALRAVENPPPIAPGDSPDAVEATLQEARYGLENIGIGEAQIEELTRTRQIAFETVLTAPAAGVIVARNAFLRQKFARGDELFRISDFRRVWIVVEVFGADAAQIRNGTAAVVSLTERPGTTLTATVGPELAQFDARSRSLSVRLHADNPELILRPGMIVDVALPLPLGDAVTVPVDAVSESESQKTVFVELGDGRFEPRRVETGWRTDGRVQVVSGLAAGEPVAVAGSFLLEAERRKRSGSAHPDSRPVPIGREPD